MNNRSILDQLVGSCVHEFFAQHEISVEAVDAAFAPHTFIAVIGFHGPEMSGVLGLGLDQGVVAKMFAGGGFDRSMAEDCIGEAANQLLGRLKNRLMSYGATLGIALPMVLRGLAVHLLEPSDAWPYRFRAAEGGITVWLDTRIAPNLVLEFRESAEPLASAEGELTLF